MVSTRSKTAQTHLEDFATRNGAPKARPRKGAAAQKLPSKPDTQKSTSKKRKLSTTDSSEKPAAKRTKTTKPTTKKSASEDEKPQSTILINRAPVLDLWAACVTHFVYPSLPWST